MNLAQLSTEVRLGLGRSDQASNIPGWINLSQRRVAENWPFRELDATSSVAVPGTINCALPSGVIILGMVMYQTGGRSYPLRWESKENFYALYPDADLSPSTGTPEAFCVIGQQIYMQPYPTTGSLKFFYTAYPDDLVEDTDELVLPYNELVIYGAIVVGMRRLEYTAEVVAPKLSMFKQLFLEAQATNARFFGGQKRQLKSFQSVTRSLYGGDTRSDPFYGL